MATNKVEVALASAGLVLLGLIGHWALSRTRPDARDGEKERGTSHTPGQAAPAGSAAQSAPALEPGGNPAQQAVIEGHVRDLLTGAGIGEVAIVFRSPGAEVTATSQANGSYTVSLAPGRYQVQAVGTTVVALDAMIEERWLVVAPETRVRDVDVHVVHLARVHGRVVDGNGDPVAGAHVRHRAELLDRVVDSEAIEPLGEARAAGDGVFSLSVLPGAVTLLATAPGQTPSSTVIRWVEPGAELHGIEIVMDAGAVIAGRVVDESGAGVGGALVGARSDGHDEPHAGHDPVSARADADGNFRLEALPPGRIALEAEAAGLAPSAPMVVHVAPGASRSDVVLVLRAPAAIRGRVVDESGAGIGNAEVRALRAMSHLLPGQAQADERGHFALTGLGSGPFDVIASAPGFAPGRLLGVSAPAQDLELVLVRSGTLTGLVTGLGRPLSQFAVRMIYRAGQPGAAPQAQPGHDEAVDPALHAERTVRFLSVDGTYRIEDLAPGRYELLVSAPGFAPVELPGVLVEPGRVTHAPAELGPGAGIDGIVRESATRAPVAGALVRLSTGSEAPATYTDDQGRFAIDDIAPGRRSLEVQHPAHVGTIRSGLDLAPGQRQSLDIYLERIPFGSSVTVEFAGIGAVLALQGEQLVVQSLVPHGPAEVAGIREGDQVVSIDGRLTQGRTLGENIEDIRGVAGTVVRLQLRRGSTELSLGVVRGTVRVDAAQPVSGCQPPAPDAP